ncbi:MFS transporter [Brevibacterium samyangense]|uniref:MFS transporter n=1 Tax=Brevibacterium samyangense TaxID=366888 RepID=A0ABN2TL94_9MICO
MTRDSASAEVTEGAEGAGPAPAAESEAVTAARKANTPARVISASMVGTTIEFFDFYAYATASSLVFPALFFPNQTSTTQLLSSFAIFGVAFIARPLGSVLFGHFGDRVGRKKTLVASLLIMGIGTFFIGLLPTAATPGWLILAPTLLVILRFSQGIGLGGEWSGAALLATENAPKGKRAIYGTFPQLGAPAGFIIANIFFVVIVAVLSEEAFLTWGWRVPFLMSALLVAVGLYVRFKLMETPAFQKASEKQEIAKAPLGQVFRSSWKALVLGTMAMVGTYVIFYFMTSFTLTWGATAATAEQAAAAAAAAGNSFDASTFVPGLGYPKTEFLVYLIIGEVFFAISIFLSGILSEKLGRKRLLLLGTAATAVYGLLVQPLFTAGTWGVILGLILGFTIVGQTFGPMAAFLPELFPVNVRYTGSAIAYNMGSVIGAGPAPFVLVALWQAEGGSIWSVGGYIVVAAAVTALFIAMTKETKDLDFEAQLS